MVEAARQLALLPTIHLRGSFRRLEPESATIPWTVITSEHVLHKALDKLSAGDPQAAEALFRQLLEQPITSPESAAVAAIQLARLCGTSGRESEAIELLQGAVLLTPEDAEIWAELASGLLTVGDLDGSLACYERCMHLGCDRPEVRNDHGVALLRAGRAEEAMLCFQALLDQQEQSLVTENLALSLDAVAREQFEANQLEAALQTLQRALNLFDAWPDPSADPVVDPEHPDAELVATLLDNTGVILHVLGRLDEAIASHERALAHAPERAASHFHLGLALLLSGVSERGWREYAWRFRKTPPSQLCARLQPPAWSEATNCSDAVLLVGEQGLGDMLQFLRYVPAAVAHNPSLQLCLPEKLHALARSSGIQCPLLTPDEAETRPAGRLLPLLSLPLHLNSATDTPSSATPYLGLPEERLHDWRRRLRADLAPGERLLGVHWQGNPELERIQHRGRSFPLELLEPIARLPGVRLVSLQRGFGAEQRRSCSFRGAFVQDQEALEAVLDFVEVGAMASACDLILSSDSALAHLCGGLGLPIWLLLKHVPDWRWGLEGEQTSWYPSMRLFRQCQPGDWRKPIEQIMTRLVQMDRPGIGGRS